MMMMILWTMEVMTGSDSVQLTQVALVVVVAVAVVVDTTMIVLKFQEALLFALMQFLKILAIFISNRRFK